MRRLDGFLTAVLESDGYNDLSHYWLEGESNPGFALVTRIEFIDDVGKPVRDHRFDTEIPPLSWFRGWEFLNALAFPHNGRYRLIALVVSQKPLVEKKAEMTRADIEDINHGPSGLSDRDWADMELTPDYFFKAYVYEFYRKTRSDSISFQNSSGVQAREHLASINFDQNVRHEPTTLFLDVFAFHGWTIGPAAPRSQRVNFYRPKSHGYIGSIPADTKIVLPSQK
jgi:hypothetical protein